MSRVPVVVVASTSGAVGQTESGDMSDDEFNLFGHEYDEDELKIVDLLALMNANQLWDDDDIQLQLQRRQLYLQMGEDLLDIDCDGTLWREVHENLFKALPDGAERSMGKQAGAHFVNQVGKLKPLSQLKFIVEGYDAFLDEQ